MASVASSVLNEVKSNSLNAVVGGFAFASAIAWLDVVRWMVSSFVDMPKTSGGYYAISALLTTLLDFENTGILDVFIDEMLLDDLARLDGRDGAHGAGTHRGASRRGKIGRAHV